VSRLEFRLASALLRALGWLFSRLPLRPDEVLLASPRQDRLEGNLAWLMAAMQRRRPDRRYVLLLEPYGYGMASKLGYLLRLVRGMYHLCRAGLVIVDNAWLPVHVGPHRAGTTVVQVWHAVGALKRFGADTAIPPAEPERTFLHRYYDAVVCAGERSRVPYAAALRTDPERVLPLGAPRTDFFFDPTAMAVARKRLLAAYPLLAGRRVILYAPTYRGRGRTKRSTAELDAGRLRAALPADHVLVLKGHPNLDPAITPTAGFDVVVDPSLQINDLFTLTDVLITDYSSSIFEWALTHRPLVLLTGDLAAYEADPGLYVDYRTEMIGAHVSDTEGVIEAILGDRFDLSAYGPFVERHLDACDGHASDRFVDRFLPGSSEKP
jgi:CDP-ribitol ribitolphosphotransferase